MKKTVTILAFVFALFALLAEAAALRCAVCGREIKGRYMVSDGKAYCSQTCFDKILPHCVACGKTIKGPYLTHDGKVYCSKNCLATIYPVCRGCGVKSAKGTLFKGEKDYFYCPTCAVLPKCFSCMLPAVGGKQLEDGRMLCRRCLPEAVWTMKDAEVIFLEVRSRMKDELNIGTRHRIQLRMVDLPSMQRRSPDYAPGTELGLFVYDATIKTVITPSLIPGGKETTQTYRSDVSYTIFFLSGTPKSKLIEVFAHELGHDWMIANYPGVKSLKLREGFSEYCAWMTNRLFGQERMNRRIMDNPDPIYGEGFRTVYKVSQDDGLSSVRQFLHRNNQ